MGAAMALPLVGSASPVSSPRVDGKVAIVTGSGRNLGRAGVLELARRGADVVVNARTNRQEAESVAREAESLGVRALALLADVGNEEQVNRMVDEVLTRFGRVDILINNAGYRPRRTFMDMTTAEWRAVLATNLDGPFFCAKAVVPSMISNGSGSIVNLSGMNSFSGAHWPHVCASKMGALGLTRALAVELGPHNIRINYVVPGGWDESATSFEDMAPESRGQARIPLRRLGIPQELANLYTFLASDDSSYITGQTFHINGGAFRY
jgi:3-oxoacyl-[acyl-carrier protein] reductase